MIKRLILFGSPGSGKGTQAVMLSEHLKLSHISLGDILRTEVKRDSELGRKVKNYMEQGKLVPDELVSSVVESNLNNGGFILDGYPRNFSQAQKLEQILQDKDVDLDAVIYLHIDQKIIVDRLSKRRVCVSCGANYHLDNMPSKKDGVCDICGDKLVQRKDDTPDVIMKRWKVFFQESKEILDFYRDKKKLIEVDGAGNKDDVFDKIKSKLQ
jgi:adenylate kinase